jgi:hypothetical protein
MTEQICEHGQHPGWCVDCLRETVRRDRKVFEYLGLQLGSLHKTCKDMQDPIRAAGPALRGLQENINTPHADVKEGR